jgi:hypothetical protein
MLEEEQKLRDEKTFNELETMSNYSVQTKAQKLKEMDMQFN